MFYTYTEKRVRTYFPELERAVAAAVCVQLRSGRDINHITVYQLYSDRIVYQWCYVCGVAREWVWDAANYSSYGNRRGEKIYVHGVAPAPACVRCGNRCPYDNIVVDFAQPAEENFAMLFELVTNKGLQSDNLLQDLQVRNLRWDTWNLMKAIRTYRQFYGLRIQMVNPPVWTPELEVNYRVSFLKYIQRLSSDTVHTRVMDMNAQPDPN